MSKELQKLVDSYLDWFITKGKPLNGMKRAYIRHLCRNNSYEKAMAMIKNEWKRYVTKTPTNVITLDVSCLKGIIDE